MKKATDWLGRHTLILIGGAFLASGYTAGAPNRHLAGAAAPLAEAGSFGPLFALAALSAIPLGLVGSVARLSYDRAS